MFRTLGFIFRKTVLRTVMVLCVCMHQYKQSSRWNSVFEYTLLSTGRLPEDEPSVSKYIEDIKIKNYKNTNLENCVSLVYIV